MGGDKRCGVGDQRTAPSGNEATSSVVATLADGGFDAEYFRRVVERVGVGVGVYDESGRFTYVNQAYADILELDVDDLVGMAVWDVNPELDEGRFDDYWDSFAVGQTRTHQSRHRTGDGDTVHVETVTTAIDVAGTRYHVGTITDIAPRIEQRRAAERQDERLEDLASVVSHDLRNPLNVAMGRLELIKGECDSEHMAHVERSLERMEALIEDVLTVARDGSRLTDPEIVDVAESVRTAWYTSAGGDATLDVPDSLGNVTSEGSRLCQIFENLISNATQHAGPDVTIRVGRLEDGFFFEDDGPGVPPDEREDVFEHGYSTNDEGTGFGLTIVREIAEAHDWSIDLTESEAGGARFEFHDVEFVDAEERA